MDSRLSDETLLRGVADRDLGAFHALYERHAGWLAIRLTRRCNDRDLVADAVPGMVLSAPFWWGFDLPLAWNSAGGTLTLLALAAAAARIMT